LYYRWAAFHRILAWSDIDIVAATHAMNDE
jgi:hypothetical protein